MTDGKKYIAIDLKSFYASVECVDRGLDPLNVNLVVADKTRTDKTICLAVSPPLKAVGVGGRPRLFEVVQKVGEINAARKVRAPLRCLTGKSYYANELKVNPSLELDYIVAPPRMQRYMDVSTKIFGIYSRTISPDDIHVYSVDEVFIDATQYLSLYNCDAHDLAMKLINDVLAETGITATAGIGTNLFLCKVAMDIVAKRMPADKHGVRIAELDEMSYRELLWDHRPLTDFWRVGKGYAAKLEANGIFTMGDIALASLGKDGDFYSEDKLYRMFGINAELLIDHAWGYEPVGISDIKSYTPDANSMSSGQVLQTPYSTEKARLIVKEMTDNLVLDLVEKKLLTDRISLNIGYDSVNTKSDTSGLTVKKDFYGRAVPKSSHGSVALGRYTSSTKTISEKMNALFESIVCGGLLVRRINVVAENIVPEGCEVKKSDKTQIDMFDFTTADAEKEETDEAKEKKIQLAVIDIKKRFGSNSILKGMNLEEGAMTVTRNGQIGGHKA